MPEYAHFGWPLRFETRADGSAGYAMVEQDTAQDLECSAAVIMCTPRGHRDDDPAFGVTTPLFQQGTIDVERLAGEITQADPRLDLDVEETINVAAATERTLTMHVAAATEQG